MARQRRYNVTEKGRERVRRSRLKHAKRVAGIEPTQKVSHEAPPQTLDEFFQDILDDLSPSTTPPPAESILQASEANAQAFRVDDIGARWTFEADQQRMHSRLLRRLTPFTQTLIIMTTEARIAPRIASAPRMTSSSILQFPHPSSHPQCPYASPILIAS